ncbi:MAG: DUF192 domain-containing protein [Bdellovibrionales bacterium]
MGKIIEVEIANTKNSRAKGLMHRKSLPVGKGMLFVYDSERLLSFWMKNTFIPLSIGFFNKDKKLLEIIKMQPVSSLMMKDSEIPSYQARQLSQFALEVPMGYFEKNNIILGSRFRFLK